MLVNRHTPKLPKTLEQAVQAFFHDDRREYYVPNPSSAAQTTTAEVVRMLYRHPVRT